jgi:hypothetical protein
MKIPNNGTSNLKNSKEVNFFFLQTGHDLIKLMVNLSLGTP